MYGEAQTDKKVLSMAEKAAVVVDELTLNVISSLSLHPQTFQELVVKKKKENVFLHLVFFFSNAIHCRTRTDPLFDMLPVLVLLFQLK